MFFTLSDEGFWRRIYTKIIRYIKDFMIRKCVSFVFQRENCDITKSSIGSVLLIRSRNLRYVLICSSFISFQNKLYKFLLSFIFDSGSYIFRENRSVYYAPEYKVYHQSKAMSSIILHIIQIPTIILYNILQVYNQRFNNHAVIKYKSTWKLDDASLNAIIIFMQKIINCNNNI